MIHLAVLLAAAVPLPTAQAPAATAELQAAPDSGERRQALRTLIMCVAKARPRWARETLAEPYLSEAQAGQAAEILSGRDNCLADPETDMTFRTSTLVGSLAEYFVRADAAPDSEARLGAALNSATPLNGSEDFALCIAARDPAAARALALSDPGTDEEMRSAKRLAAFVQPCTQPGENLTVDLQSLRALVATAMYRAMSPKFASRQ